jgi:AcrR family transcriptional regulator
MGRPREHDDTTREALLTAAEQLLGRGSPLSVRVVADATATTTRAVYSVFGSMEGLYRALVERAFNAISARVEALPITRDPAADLVAAGVQAFRRFALEQPELFRIAFERMVPDGSHDSETISVMAQALRALIVRVERCKAAGLLGNRSARVVTWQFHALCQGLASVELQGWLPPGDDPETIWRDALAVYVAGLGASSPRRRTARSR